MHVAAIGSSMMPLEWWNWILLRQQQHYHQARSSVFSPSRPSTVGSQLWTKQTDQGQTVVELFFRTALDPLPWCKHSLKERAGRLKDVIERILVPERIGDNNARNSEAGHQIIIGYNFNNIEDDDSTDSMLEKLRELVLEDNEKDSNKGNRLPSVEEEDGDVAVVFRFWKKLTALLCTPTNQSARHSIVDVLSGLPWCPELVGRLAIALFPRQVQGYTDGVSVNSSTIISDGGNDNDNANDDGAVRVAALILPLHRCVRYFGAGGVSQSRGMLPVLCEAHPSAASVPDLTSSGRLPLHVALASPGQHSWEGTLKHLFEAYPPSVQVADPVTGLPAFCLASDALAAPITDHQTEQNAKTVGNHSLCWYYLSGHEKAKALKEACLRLECQKLTVMYEVLRRDPSVLGPVSGRLGDISHELIN
jgi:hypothetical protein